ncbi:MAG: hypothetical protein PHH49_07010 [Candidatus Omnitrophica bacterium]|nr:hypothetical protein [Candidatus Omnitrophota bacterium]MDD5488688.1 hypothetical protein [Candidatus Omnitrophota bacterium]
MPEDRVNMVYAEDDQENIGYDIVERLSLPKGYHEGLFMDNGEIWVNNGEHINTWVIDPVTGEKKRDIIPVGTFTESVTKDTEGRLWVSDWNEKKVFHVEISEGKMRSVGEISFEPGHPTGTAWAEGHLYVITWERGAGTKYYLNKVSPEGKIVLRARIKGISEPSMLAWDGKDLWVSSWYYRRIYRIGMDDLGVIGYIISPVDKTTGIVWEDGYLWVTGTYGDLYKLKIRT